MISGLEEFLGEYLSTSTSLLSYIFIFLGGLLAGLTPCTYPILPIISGYIGATADKSLYKSFILSLIFVISMALSYAMIGVIFCTINIPLGYTWNNPWALFFIAVFFVTISLFLLESFHFPTSPASFLNRISNNVSNNAFTSFLLGTISSFIVGPCTGPIIALLAVSVVTTSNHEEGVPLAYGLLLGGLKFFIFGLGQGVLILLVGTFSGLLAHIPKSGKWLLIMKRLFALILLAFAMLMFIYIGQNTDFPPIVKALGLKINQTINIKVPL
jgi:thiol:disulfide interchange protein